MRFYTDFKNKRLGKRIDYDNAYGYQCVDLVKQYLAELTGEKIGAIGNANQLENSNYFKKWAKVKLTTIYQGDIIIRNRGTYWHVGIVDRILGNKVHVLEQNGKGGGDGIGENAIRVKDYSISWFDVVLRNGTIVDNYNAELDYCNYKINDYEEKIRELSINLNNTIGYKNAIKK